MALSESAEVFASARHLRAIGKQVDIARMPVAAGIAGGGLFGAGAQLLIEPTGYSATSFEFGLRRFFAPMPAILPYVGVSAGITHTSSIDIVPTLVRGTRSQTGEPSRFASATFAPSAGLELGVSYAPLPQVALGIETGIRFDGRLRADDDDLGRGDGGLAGFNNGTARLSVPLRLTGRIAF